MNRRYAILAAVLLILVITISLFFTVNPLSKKASNSPFYVGVEFAYGNQFNRSTRIGAL